jgi:hypothetical protein
VFSALRIAPHRTIIFAMTPVSYMIDGHRVELVESADGVQWVCNCRTYRARPANFEGPRCRHAWDAWLFVFTERMLTSAGVTAPKSIQ